MPLYEYKCTKCLKKFEILQKINSEPLKNCPECQGKVEKLISRSSFQFKGSGWYITDYKNKEAKKPENPKKSTVPAKNNHKDNTSKSKNNVSVK